MSDSRTLPSNPSNAWPELDASAQEWMRTKARPMIASGLEAYGHMSDEWVANRARMLYRDDLEHEAICLAARDRVMRLSIQLAEARGVIDTLKARATPETCERPVAWCVEASHDGSLSPPVAWRQDAVLHQQNMRTQHPGVTWTLVPLYRGELKANSIPGAGCGCSMPYCKICNPENGNVQHD